MWCRFAFRLAVAFGRFDVETMLREMSWLEFVDWSTFYAVEPFGEIRADLRAGEITAAVYNVNRDPSKSAAVGPTDVMPFLRAEVAANEPKVSSWDALRARYAAYAAQVEEARRQQQAEAEN